MDSDDPQVESLLPEESEARTGDFTVEVMTPSGFDSSEDCLQADRLGLDHSTRHHCHRVRKPDNL